MECHERLISEVTYYVSSGTLDQTETKRLELSLSDISSWKVVLPKGPRYEARRADSGVGFLGSVAGPSPPAKGVGGCCMLSSRARAERWPPSSFPQFQCQERASCVLECGDFTEDRKSRVCCWPCQNCLHWARSIVAFSSALCKSELDSRINILSTATGSIRCIMASSCTGALTLITRENWNAQ